MDHTDRKPGILVSKMKLLLEKVIEPGYIINTYYSDALIDKLSNSTDDPEIEFLDSFPLLPDMLVEALSHLETCHMTVRVFVVRLLAVACKNELRFSKVFLAKGSEIASYYQEMETPNLNPSLRVALMETALSVIKHHSGFTWLLQTGVWKYILNLSNANITVFVVRQKYKFAANFVWKLNENNDEPNVRAVLEHILLPLKELDYFKERNVTIEEEDKVLVIIEPILQMLHSIITHEKMIEKQSIVVNLIINHYTIKTQLCLMLEQIRKEEMLLLLSKLLIWVSIGKIFLAKPYSPDVVYNAVDVLECSATQYNILQGVLTRRSSTLAIDVCYVHNHIWMDVWKDKKIDSGDDNINLKNEYMYLVLVPSLLFIKRDLLTDLSSPCTSDGLNMFLDSMKRQCCEHTTRAGSLLCGLIQELGIEDAALHSIKRMTCLKFHLSQEQANIVFQTTFYVLKKILVQDIIEDYDQSYSHEQKLTYVLDILLFIVKNYNVQWRETLEVICLYSLMVDTLQKRNLSCKCIVQAINVITVTVRKFLQPNLSLLMEAKPGSLIEELGKLIYTKLHDRNWEVRDSALELLLVCTEISLVKFPQFQSQILENNLLNVAVTLMFNDFQSYVQASALKCVAAACMVPSIWDQLRAQHPDIQDSIVLVLRNNQEGIVRKEACSTLCSMYEHLKLTPAFQQTLYEHMASSALADFHWEVQLSALKYWKVVIKSLLSNQGMLDGTFPPVTFSKESRKIVTLNEKEIQRRLICVLEELSSVGCLTVLVKLLSEDTEVDVLESALAVASDLLEILNQHKVPDVLKQGPNEVASIEELNSSIVDFEDSQDTKTGETMEAQTSEESEKMDTQTPKSDSVIEGILNANDVNLLSNIYERHMNLYGDNPAPQSVRPKIKLLKSASPYFFVNYLKGKDFKALIEEKKRWKDGIRNVSSLLDDMLGIYEIQNDDVNTLDCY